MDDTAAPVATMAGVHSPNIDELFQRLKQHDCEWLSRILYNRWLALVHENPYDDDIYNESSQSPIWPFDVTLPRLPRDLQVSDYIKFVRDFDWGSTRVGPMSRWSLDMRRMVNMCLCDKRAAAIWIGADHLSFYNEGYAMIAGNKHPHFLGQSFKDMWSEPGVAEQFESYFDQGNSFGVASTGDSVMYTLERYGWREEMWASFSVIPVPDSVGGVFGCYNIVFEVTKQHISGRRLSLLLSLGTHTAFAVTAHELWLQIIATFDSSPSDIPFAVVYSLEDREARTWHLEGSVGLPDSFEGFPDPLSTDDAVRLVSPAFVGILFERQPVFLSMQDGMFPGCLRGIAKTRTAGDLCTGALLLPIGPTNRDNILGFMIVGVNPLCKYDADYEQFAQLLMRQCATSMASVVLMEDELRETRRVAEVAARDRVRLSEQLAESQTQVVENEARFRTMADMAPVAMFHLDQEGKILYANKIWHDLTQHEGIFGPMSWSPFVHPEDRALAEQEFTKLLQGEPVSFEMRWRRPYAPQLEYVGGERVEGATWTIASAYVEKRTDGTVKSVLGCLTDISRQKWMENFHERRVKEALELKRQQENFMDMISHETRNPLSAIMLSIESVINGLKDISALKTDPVFITQDTVRSYLESAEVIMTCAQHQKRIVDDVLTLSKLDSGLLTICPVETRPMETIGQALKMFDAEVQKHDMALHFVVDSSYQELQIDWVRLDPSRLLQVLINLLTNAIKFTLSEAVRSITVTLAASTERPTESLHQCKYVQNEWVDAPPLHADQVFLSLEVIDTGRGITADEMKKLFKKFQQANPKTHVEYGGSGLGLFISRQLSRMQGGAIGVASSGKGATFAFYILVARCSMPEVQTVRKSSATSVSTPDSVHPSDTPEKRRTSQAGLLNGGPDPPATRQTSVLLVEDNLVNQKVMRTMLERAHYTVHVANHGLEALEHIVRSRFGKDDGVPLDVVLLDVEMPVCNGLECARRLRQLQKSGQLNAHVPVIGVTANARTEQQVAALEAGMDAVVTKPFRLAELSAKLESIMHRFYTSGEPP